MPFYSISELAKEFAITTRTLRYYEEKGMLTPTRKNNQRLYTAKDRTTLRLILRGKRLGFSLQESYEIIGLYNSENNNNNKQINILIGHIEVKHQILMKQKKDIEHTLHDLTMAKQRCLAAMILTNDN